MKQATTRKLRQPTVSTRYTFNSSKLIQAMFPAIKQVLNASLTLSVFAMPAYAEDSSIKMPTQPLGQALEELTTQTGDRIIAPSRLVEGKTAAGIRGELSTLEAVQQLLKNTTLKAVETASGTITIRRQKADKFSTLDTVVVTALKRESSLKNAPRSISVLSSEEVVDKGITDFRDLVDESPGISIGQGFGGRSNSFLSVRGIGGADDYKSAGSPSVALHVDGIYQTSNAYLNGLPLFDVKRVEVLKGPQGTLYGRNTTAGTVNIINKGPTETFEGFTSFEKGSFGFTSGTAAAGGPVNDKLGARVAVLYEHGGGFMEAEGAGRFAGFVPEGFEGVIPPINDPDKTDGWGDADRFAVRGTATYDFDANSLLTLRTFFSRDRGDNRQSDRVAFEKDPRPERNAGEDGDPFSFFSNQLPEKDVDIIGVNADFEHQFNSNLNLDVLFGYQQASRKLSGNGDGTSFTRFQFDLDEELDQTSIEARLSDSPGGFINWTVGSFAITDEVEFLSTWRSLAVRTVYDQPERQKRESVALFGNVDWFLTNNLTVTTGLRFTKDWAESKGANIDRDPWGTSRFTDFFSSPLPFSWDEKFQDENVSGRVTGRYDITDRINVFASVATGYRSGGFDGTSKFSIVETKPFDSEDVLAYESGLRYVSNRIRSSLDLFAYDFDDLQATARLSNDTNGRTNVGESEVRGFEASVTATLLDTTDHRLSVKTAGTFLDTEITEFKSNRVEDVENTEGDDLPGAPEWSQTASLTYERRVTHNVDVTGSLDYSFHGEESSRINALEGNTTDSYSLLDYRLELLINDAIEVYTYGRNLTDETYFVDLNAGARTVGAPRTWGGGFRYKF